MLSPMKESKFITLLTGFSSHGEFMNILQFLLPNLDRKMQICCDTATRKSSVIKTEKLLSKYTKTGVVL